LRQRKKLYPCLPRAVCPSHAAGPFNPNPWVRQIEAQRNLLVGVQRSDCLNCDARFTQIADNASVGMICVGLIRVGLIQVDVCQATNLVAVLDTLPAWREANRGGIGRLGQSPGIHGQILAKRAKASQYRRWFGRRD